MYIINYVAMYTHVCMYVMQKHLWCKKAWPSKIESCLEVHEYIKR